MSVISAKEFRERATRVIEIDGFSQGEKIEVRIKPASILNLYVSGKMPNNLLSTVQNLFNMKDNDKNINDDKNINKVFDDPKMMKASFELMDLVCKECLVEPKYEEISDLLTDNQKGQIMAEAQGNVTAAIPSVQK